MSTLFAGLLNLLADRLLQLLCLWKAERAVDKVVLIINHNQGLLHPDSSCPYPRRAMLATPWMALKISVKLLLSNSTVLPPVR